MENDPDAMMRGLAGYGVSDPPREDFAPSPQHDANVDKPLDLGAGKVAEPKKKKAE
jgi:hypothetical protein